MEIIKFNPTDLIKENWITQKETALAKALDIKAVNSDDDLENSGSIQSGINKLIKALGRERLNCTRPIDTLKKEITNLEKKEIKELNIELNRLKSLNNEYATKLMREQQEARRIAEEKARAEAEKAAAEQISLEQQAKDIFGEDAEVIDQPIEITVELPKVEKPKTTANKFVETWNVEVVNNAEIPRQFLEVNISKLKQFVKMDKGQTIIPGTKVYKTISVQSK